MLDEVHFPMRLPAWQIERLRDMGEQNRRVGRGATSRMSLIRNAVSVMLQAEGFTPTPTAPTAPNRLRR